MNGTKRNPYFDILKGIGIIAVVVGHLPIPAITGILHQIIFVWHMPLFFLVSGYFFRPKPFNSYLRKNIKGLLIPYLLTAFVMFLLSVCLYCLGMGINPIHSFVAIFVGAGVDLPYFTGPIWFLLAMFWCREIYNCLLQKLPDKYVIGGVILILFMLTVNSYRWLYIPTNLLQGINAMLFFHIGYVSSKYEWVQKPCKWLWVAVAVILLIASVTVFNTLPINMVVCYYTCWPLNVIAAVGCVYVLYHLSVWFSRNLLLKRFFSFFGSISLLVLCVHTIDFVYGTYVREAINRRLLHFERWQHILYVDVWHLSVALIGSWILIQSKIVRRLFQ